MPIRIPAVARNVPLIAALVTIQAMRASAGPICESDADCALLAFAYVSAVLAIYATAPILLAWVAVAAWHHSRRSAHSGRAVAGVGVAALFALANAVYHFSVLS